MANDKSWYSHLVQEKNKTLTAVKEFRTKIDEDRTLFNISALEGEHKLSQAYLSVRNLEFRDKDEIKIQSFKEYLKLRGDILQIKFKVEEMDRPEYPADESYRNRRSYRHYPKGNVLVLVESSIYSAVAASIDQYVLDIGRDGYWGTIHSMFGGTPQQVKSYIKEHNCIGVLMVGSVAVPWYELDNDFHGAHSEFPCDLYYMDKNANWTDSDGDGKFNNVTGNVDPEIWVGRVWSPTQDGNDAALINDYFTRNHKFRVGDLGHARSALAYVDDDWQGFDDCEFDQMFPSSEITKYTNPDVTDGDLYKAEVNTLRSWVQLCAHSSVYSHSLRVPSEGTTEYVNNAYFRDTNPPNAHFYNLFCCGPGKYSQPDYLAGWYIFDKSGGGTNHGLTAVASAKSGSMLMFADFYKPMGQGKVIGDAYLNWWKARGPSHDLGEKRWYYGLTLLGDPTLTWWKGNVPKPEQPHEEDVFDHWPRKMQLRWDPVNLSNVKYTVEVDAFGAVNSGQWAEQTNQTFLMQHNITGTTMDHNFVGMQRGRWRVRAKVGNRLCSWSPWSYFRFTI